MNDLDKIADPALPGGIPIGAVERDTGLSKDTLRIWERRYGFPQPGRDGRGERSYPPDQVEKLRALKRLMDRGHRPGKLIDLPIDALREMASNAAARTDTGGSASDLGLYLQLMKAHRPHALHRELSQALLRMGLSTFVTQLVAPLTEEVGEAWSRGEFEIFEEHLYTEVIQALLRSAIGDMPRMEDVAAPRVLLTTFPQESHGLGILMVEALLLLEGAQCTSLGVQTPIREIAAAALAPATGRAADIVALSFSAALASGPAIEGITELRRLLPEQVEIWAGGGCTALYRRELAGIHTLRTLEQAVEALREWRRLRHQAA